MADDRTRAKVPASLAIDLRAEFFEVHNELKDAGNPEAFALVGAIQYLTERAYAAGQAAACVHVIAEAVSSE